MIPRIAALILAATAFLGGCASLPRPSPDSAAVRVRFDGRHVGRAEARGLADPATGRRLAADDPVRVASISKLITTLGVMRLIEAGTLDLDQDVSRWLGWPLRNPAFPDKPITLRLLLSHRSSLADGVDYVIPLGRTLKETVADPKAWDPTHPPGTFFRYTNLNFPVVATVMEAATHERFDRLMDRLVFKPLAIDGCYNWTRCSDAVIARAVVLRDGGGKPVRDDLHGAQPDCPVVPAADGSCDLASYVPGTNGALFSPQGGARISANGLARIGQMFLRGGEGFLSRASITAMIGPEWRYDGGNGETDDGYYCRYGLAVHLLATPGCKDDPFGDGRQRIGHSGDAYGLRSGLWVDRARGQGIAYFAIGMPDDAPKGRSAFTRAEEALAQGR